MAAGDLNFGVGVDTAGAVRSLKNLEGALSNVTNAFRLTIAGISIGAIAKFSDEITSLKNRLMLLSDTQEQATTQFKALAAIAIASRTDLAATGDLYFRIARNAKEMGISQAEAAQITESLAKAMTASGASASESAGPLLQLGQALQSGRFQGDELRSILEGLPTVARALADSLGVPIGALRSMGAAGQITSRDFIEAMRKARDSIEKDFAKTVPTIGSAFNELKASTALAFSEFEKSTQTGQSFALAIEYLGFTIYKLSKTVDEIVGPLTTFIKVAGSLVAFLAVGRIFIWLTEIFGLLGSGIAALSSRASLIKDIFLNFGKVVEVAGSKSVAFGMILKLLIAPLAKIAGFLIAIGSAVGTFLGLDKVFDWFKSLGESNSESKSELEEYRKELSKFKGQLDTTSSAPAPTFLDPEKMRKAKNELDKIVNSYAQQNSQLEQRLKFEQELIGVNDQQRSVRQSLFDLEGGYLQEVNKLLDDYREKSNSKTAEDQAQLPLIQAALVKVTETYQKQIDIVKNLTEETYKLNEAEKQRVALSEFSIKTILDGEKQIRDIQNEMANMTLPTIEKRYKEIENAAKENAKAAIDAENSRRRNLKLSAMSKDEEIAYYEAAKQKVKELQSVEKQRYDFSRQWSTGWTKAFNQYLEDATNAAAAAERIFAKATQGMEDMIVNFAKTGKLEWKSFVNSMLEELLRSQIRQVMSQILSFQGGTGQGNGGGFFKAIGGLLGFANGGIIPSNEPVIVGERGPELLMGASGRQVIPNEKLGTTTQVTYNINAVDASSFKSMVAADPSFIHAVAMQGAKSVPGRR